MPVLLAVACTDPLPPVPPPLTTPHSAGGAHVRFGSVSGYLVRPGKRSDEASAEIWTGDPHHAASQDAARAHAATGVRVLLVSPAAAAESAAQYLREMPPKQPQVRRCTVGCGHPHPCEGTCGDPPPQ